MCWCKTFIRSRLLSLLTASLPFVNAARSDAGSHNRLDLIQSRVPAYYVCNRNVCSICKWWAYYVSPSNEGRPIVLVWFFLPLPLLLLLLSEACPDHCFFIFPDRSIINGMSVHDHKAVCHILKWPLWDLDLWPQGQIIVFWIVFSCPDHNIFVFRDRSIIFGMWVHDHKAVCRVP